MTNRRLPIMLGVIMIVALVVLIVGWVLLAVLGAMATDGSRGLFWTLLSVGTVIYVFLLVGVSIYLALTIKSINLTRRQSNFIDSVTHELKSPIASIKLSLQTLSRHKTSIEEQAKFQEAMLEDLTRLDQLIDHMLDASRLSKKTELSELEKVDLAPVLQDCCDTICMRYRLDHDLIALKTKTCYVHARRVDLDVLFRNLIDNAVKYSDNPPEVEVACFPQEDFSVVTISDNGRGIPPKMRRKIFGRFVRLGSELKRDRPGTGLGLYIVRTLVKRLRGRVRINDRPDGVGTVFQVELPYKSEN
ncbi:MAG: HAMP domain-containing sensor histidine kinase [Planctomycetia bacterium]|jgi:signal transduction histidine kinase